MTRLVTMSLGLPPGSVSTPAPASGQCPRGSILNYQFTGTPGTPGASLKAMCSTTSAGSPDTSSTPPTYCPPGATPAPGGSCSFPVPPRQHGQHYCPPGTDRDHRGMCRPPQWTAADDWIRYE